MATGLIASAEVRLPLVEPSKGLQARLEELSGEQQTSREPIAAAVALAIVLVANAGWFERRLSGLLQRHAKG